MRRFRQGREASQIVTAHSAPEKGTGWHRHEADFHIVLMLKGWARFMYEDQETLVAAGDCVHQRPGIRHYLFDYSPDMEYLEVVSPADFKTIDVEPPCELTPGIRPYLKQHHLQAGVGHYGVFSGRRWQRHIYPIVRNVIQTSRWH